LRNEKNPAGDGNNLHRNVLFRGDASEANRLVPFSQFDSQNPEDMWKFLDKFQMDTGAKVLAVPHNSNLSNGRMFSVATFNDKPLTRELAELRASPEPIIEATQIKGDSEAHSLLSPTSSGSASAPFVPGQYADTADTRVDAVGDREIDAAELAPECHRGPGAPVGELAQPRATAAGQHQGQRLAGQPADVANIVVVHDQLRLVALEGGRPNSTFATTSLPP
jgi:hypothetical protein